MSPQLSPRPSLLVALATVCSMGPIAAQAPDAVATALEASHGLTSTPDGLLAGGPHYRAAFGAGQMTFTPALGRAAARTMPLTFRLDSIAREDGTPLRIGEDVAPRAEGSRVVYDHPDGVEERYEVTAAGLEQSFWFPARPAGSGDLVVRGRLTTELASVAAQAVGEGPLFELAGVGGVRFGGVTGIAADGSEQAGSIRVVGDVLELSLPAAFVDAAAYPLLLDPLIGTELDLTFSSSFQDDAPAVAYDDTNACYLVVWSRVFSLLDAEIRGQRVSSAGTLTGNLIPISITTNTIALLPDVASVDLRDHFVVAWQELVVGNTETQIRAASVAAFDGAVSPSILVSASNENQTDVAVGGDRGLVDDDALVVWDEDGTGIRARQINVGTTGTLGYGGSPVVVVPDTILGTYGSPAISRSGGDDGQYVIASVLRNLITGTTAIVADAVTRDLTPIGTRVTVSGVTGTLDDDQCSVDGNGENFLVAYTREEFPGSSNRDVYCRSLRISGAQLVFNLPEKLLNGSGNSDQSEPAVSYLGFHSIVAYLDESIFWSRVQVESVDPYTGLRSGEVLIASTTTGVANAPAVASQYSGGALERGTLVDDALVSWGLVPSGGSSSNVYAIRYDAGTSNLDVGGGCGGGGQLLAPAAFGGNGNFTARVEDAPPSSLTLLVAASQQFSIPCGPCTLLPFLDGSETTLVGMTDGDGIASFPIAIPPSAQGTAVLAQAITFLPGGPCPQFQQVRLSNGVWVAFD